MSHYNTVIKSETLYVSETLDMNRKGELENIKRTGRRMMMMKKKDIDCAAGKRPKRYLPNIIHDTMKRRLKY